MPTATLAPLRLCDYGSQPNASTMRAVGHYDLQLFVVNIKIDYHSFDQPPLSPMQLGKSHNSQLPLSKGRL